MAYPVSWTPEDIETLKTMWAKGDTAKQIAKAIEERHTRSAVLGKAMRLKLERREDGVNREWHHRTKPYVYKAPKPKLPAVGADTTPEPQPLGLPGDLSDGCRWPHGDTSTQNFRFCGHPRESGRPYCSHHVQRAYVKPYPSKK